AGQEHDAVAQSQPSSSTPPVPSTSSPQLQSPPPIPTPTPPHIPTPTPPPIPTPTPTPPPIPTLTPTPIPETEPAPFRHIYEESSPVHQHFSPPQEQAQGQRPMDDLLQVVPQLISRIDSLETDLKQTKLTMGNALVKLVKKVKKLEGFLKRRKMVLSDSEEEEPEAKERRYKRRKERLRERRRYKRRKEAKGKKVVLSLDFQEEVDTGAEGVSTGSTKLSTGSEQVSTVGDKKSTSSDDKGQREGKAPMIIEEAPKKSKEQVLQEEASLAEAIRLDNLQKEEVAKQLVKKVKKLEGFLKRRNMVLTDSEEEDAEAQGRKSQDDPQDFSVQGLVTPSTTKVKASGEEQEEDISPNTLEAAKT
ncbi:hypothetical protein Tco_1531694, partial [Tanacetum coccineum]